MAKKKDKKKAASKRAIFVLVYGVDLAGWEHRTRAAYGDLLMPGSILKIPEKDVPAWSPYLERARARRVGSLKEAKALSASIEDGSFQFGS